MAGNNASLSFRLFGEDLTASKAIRGVGKEADTTAEKLKNIGSKGLSPLMSAAATLGPALIPVLAGATLAAGALGVAAVSAGAAVGVFAAVAKTAYGNIGAAAKTLATAHTNLAAANTKVTAAQYALSQAHTKTGLTAAHHRLALAMDAQAKAAGQLAHAQSTLTGPLGAAAAAQGRATAAWKQFVALNSPAVYGVFRQGFTSIAAAIPKLEPLFRVAARAASELLVRLGQFVTLGGLDRMVRFLTAQAIPALHAFMAVGANLAAGFGALGRLFITASGGILTGVVRLSAGFAAWALHLGPGGGFSKFVAYVKANGPAVMATLGSIAVSMVHIVAAVSPLAPLSLAVAKGLSGIVNALPPAVLTGLVGGFIALNLAFKAVAVSTAVAAAATKVWAAANWLLDAAMTANPIGILIVTIAALVGGIVYAYIHFETFRNIVNGVWSWIKDHWPLLAGILLGPLGFAVIEMIKHWKGFVGFFTSTAGHIVDAAKAVGSWFAGWPGFFSRIWHDVTGFFVAAAARITAVFAAVVDWFKALPGRLLAGLLALPGLMFRLFTEALNRAMYAVGYGIGTIIRIVIETPGRIWAALKTLGPLLWKIMVDAWNFAKAATTTGIAAVVSFWLAMPGRAARAVSKLWSAMAGAFRTAAVSAGREASTLVSNAITWLGQLPGRAARAVSRLWSAMVGAFRAATTAAGREAQTLVTGAVKWISELPGKAAKALTGMAAKVKGAFTGAASWLISAGEDIMRGLIKGIGNMVGSVLTAIKNAVGSAVSGAKHALGIGSPSKVFADEVGRWIPPGIAAGIAAGTPHLVGAMSAAMGHVVNAARVPVTGSVGLGQLPSPASRRGAGGSQTGSGSGETLVAQFYLDGKLIQESLLTRKRLNGALGLA